MSFLRLVNWDVSIFQVMHSRDQLALWLVNTGIDRLYSFPPFLSLSEATLAAVPDGQLLLFRNQLKDGVVFSHLKMDKNPKNIGSELEWIILN